MQIFRQMLLLLLLSAVAIVPATARPTQLARRDGTAEAASEPVRRMRLYLKDGSYQLITSYRVSGERVRYVSAERGGQTEEIPLKLVDLTATEKWTRDHTAGPDGLRPAPAIDPELAREEAARAELAPEVAPDLAPGLRLAPEDPILALDTFRAIPELAPMVQTDGTPTRLIGHAELKGEVSRQSATHGLVTLRGEKADVQFHIDKPVFYLRLDDAQMPGDALTVDTHGASSAAGRSKPSNLQDVHDYVIVRTDVRQDARVVGSFEIAAIGTAKRQQDVFATDPTVLPGGHWLRLESHESLLIGEYALVEALSDHTVNLGVWDFGVHPTAPENRDLIVAEKRRTGLGRRE